MNSNLILTVQLHDPPNSFCLYNPNAQKKAHKRKTDPPDKKYIQAPCEEMEMHITNIVRSRMPDMSFDSINYTNLVGGYIRIPEEFSLKNGELVLYRVDEVGKFIIHHANNQIRDSNKMFYNNCKQVRSTQEPVTAVLRAIFSKLKEEFEPSMPIMSSQNNRLKNNLWFATTHILNKTNSKSITSPTISFLECMILGTQIIFQAKASVEKMVS